MSSKTDSTGRWTVVLFGTLLVAAVLRFIGLQSGLWYDEIMTLVLSVRHPFSQIVTEFVGVNAHPLYSVMAHASLSVFGESAWALRLPAAVFGIASVLMVYLLAVQILPRVEAWVAAITMATSYHHVWFSQNARGYTLMGFLTLLSTFFLLRAARTGRRADYVIYACACAAGIYTHLTMAFVVGGHAAVLLLGHALHWRPALTQSLRPMLWAWIAAAALSVLAYAPFVPGIVALMGLEATQQATGVTTLSWLVTEALRSLFAGTGMPAALLGGFFAAFGAVSLLRRWPLVFMLLVAPAVVTGLTLVALGQPIRPRFFFFLSGAAAVFVGRGIGAVVEAIAARRAHVQPAQVTAAVVACACVLLALSATALPTNYRVPKQDFDGAVSFLEAAEMQGARIAMAGPACPAFELYYLKSWPCLKAADDVRTVARSADRLLVVYTLAAYIADPVLREDVRTNCVVQRRFPGTLGDGEITVCALHPSS